MEAVIQQTTTEMLVTAALFTLSATTVWVDITVSKYTMKLRPHYKYCRRPVKSTYVQSWWFWISCLNWRTECSCMSWDTSPISQAKQTIKTMNHVKNVLPQSRKVGIAEICVFHIWWPPMGFWPIFCLVAWDLGSGLLGGMADSWCERSLTSWS